MKKFLALVLALVMTMSLVTISSSAAFSDAADIDYVEAVNVLNGLGVIDGMGDGTFSPNGGVTRAQMAKMITFIKLGVVEASAFEGTKTDLTDVDGHWAEAFIKFCYSQGIIAGKGNGKFDPDANVTTAEAAKMLLVALGWNADVQGYVGEQWKVNTIRDAYTSKVFEGINLASDKAVDRDEAAKLIYNTILTSTVVTQSSKDREDGSISDSYIQNGPTLLNKTFQATRYEGVMSDNIGWEANKSNFVYNGSYTVFNGTATVTSFKSTEDYTDLVNEEVTVVTQVVDNTSKTVGIYPTGDTTVKYAYASSLGTVSGKLKVDGVAYGVEGEAATLQSNVASDSYLNSTNIVKLTDVDEDGDFDNVYEYVYEVGKVVYVSDAEIITDNGASFSYADDAIDEGIAKDDYVSSFKHFNGAFVVEEIAPFEAVASAIKVGKDSVQFDGTWYNDGDYADDDDFTAGNTYRVWALNGVVVASKQLNGSEISDLVLAYAKGGAWGGEVKYIGVDGEKKTVSQDKTGTYVLDLDTLVNASDRTDGALAIINETQDGVEFKDPAQVSVGSSYTYVAGGTIGRTDGKIADIDGTPVSSDAVILVRANDGVAKLTGSQLKNLTNNNLVDGVFGYYVSSNVSGLLTRVTYAGVQFNGNVDDINATSGKEIYAYVTSDAVKVNIGGSDYAQYTIWNGSENLTIKEKGGEYFTKGTVVYYDSIDENGVANAVENASAVTAAVYGIEGKKVTIDNANAYDLTGDTKYLYINSNASSADEIGKTGGELQVASKYTENNYVMDNVAYALNGSGEFTIIVVDVANSMTRDNTVKVLGGKAYTDTEKAKCGDTIVFTAPVAGSFTISNVAFADGTSVSGKAVAKGQSITVFASGAGDITVSFS